MLTRAQVWKVVDRATALLAGRGWTRRAYARDARGNPVHAWDPEAACFCMTGAVHRANDELGTDIPRLYDISFNDGVARNKWDVIRELERQAERLCATLPE